MGIILSASASSSITFAPFMASNLPPTFTRGRHHSTSRFIAIDEELDVAQAKRVDGFAKKSSLFLGGFDEYDLRVGTDDGQRNSRHAAAAADVGQAMRAFGEKRQKRQCVADVADLGGGAIGDACEVDGLVGFEQEVEIA